MEGESISVTGISKKFDLGAINSETLREHLTEFVRRLSSKAKPTDSKEEFWALKDISFSVKPGEVVGIIGKNGAGKSTLLKILSRITPPTKGQIEINGRLASLLEVGTGFHPELTGRENVYLNGSILGMKKAEINEQFDAIIDFAGIHKFVDTPVKRYSSGMYVRLAFAVAAHLNPEILIIDEVLAVGDLEFQKKCLGKMNELASTGRTIIFVSHNMGAVLDLCNRAILIENGAVKYDDTPEAVINQYLQSSVQKTKKKYTRDPSDEAGTVEVKSIEIQSTSGEPTTGFNLEDPINIVVDFEVKQSVQDYTLQLIVRRNGHPIFQSFQSDMESSLMKLEPGKYRSICTIDGMFIKAGLCTVSFFSTAYKKEIFEKKDDIVSFEIFDYQSQAAQKGFAVNRYGNVLLQGSWVTNPIAE